MLPHLQDKRCGAEITKFSISPLQSKASLPHTMTKLSRSFEKKGKCWKSFVFAPQTPCHHVVDDALVFDRNKQPTSFNVDSYQPLLLELITFKCRLSGVGVLTHYNLPSTSKFLVNVALLVVLPPIILAPPAVDTLIADKIYVSIVV